MNSSGNSFENILMLYLGILKSFLDWWKNMQCKLVNDNGNAMYHQNTKKSHLSQPMFVLAVQLQNNALSDNVMRMFTLQKVVSSGRLGTLVPGKCDPRRILWSPGRTHAMKSIFQHFFSLIRLTRQGLEPFLVDEDDIKRVSESLTHFNKILL